MPATADTKGVPGLGERWAFVVMMLVSSGFTHFSGGGDADTGSPLAEAVWGLAYILAVVGIIAERELARRLIRSSWPLLLIVAFAVMSTLWSDDALLTLRRSFGLLGTTVIALYVVVRYRLPAFIDTFVLTVNAIALVSIVLIVLTPDIGVMQGAYQGAWRGVFWEKNRFGESMAVGVATMLLLAGAARGRGRAQLRVSLAMCTILMLGSRSTTAIVGFLAVLASVFVMFLRDRQFGFRASLLGLATTILAGCASVIGYGPTDVLGLFGRDTTLTGRTQIWTTVVDYISRRPLLGYGYQVFWEPDGPIRRYLTKDLGWEPVSAHNGYLQVALDMGLTGLLLFLLFLVEAVRRAWRYYRTGPDRLGAWPLLVMVSLVVMNFADANFALYNEFLWLVFMIAFLYATAGTQLIPRLAPQPDHASAAPPTQMR